jgi:YYY domain-containing protein
MLSTDFVTRTATRVRTERAGVIAHRLAVPVALSLILFLGGFLRFTGRNWDEGQYLHPDERFLTMVATGISWPGSISEYFDSARSPLNPYNYESFPTFIYGTFPLFLGKLVGDLTGNNVYGNFHLAARSLSATFDLLTILLVFLVGRRLFGAGIGLVAALLQSLTVLNIQLAHFGTFDTFVTTFCLATFYFALLANDRGRWWDFTLAGIFAGLAIATKLSALPILAVVALPLVEQLRQHGPDAYWRRTAKRGLPVLLGVALAVITAVWTFRISQPYAFAGPSPFDFSLDSRWTLDVERWRVVQSGESDPPPSTQWANRTPLLFVVDNLVRWGMGPALGITALIALGLGLVRLLTARRWPPTWMVILIGWPLFHIVYYGFAFLKTMRYLVPAYPFLVLLAAAALVGLSQRGVRRTTSRWRWESLPLLIMVGATAFYAFAFTSIYTTPTTRVAASEWIYENVPAGSFVLAEHWDDGVPLALPGSPGPGIFVGQQLELYHADNAEKLGQMLIQLENADYIFITSNRLYGSIPRIPERYPMTIEYYRMLFSGELGFDLVQTFTSRPELLGIEFNDDNAEEAFTVYDHPKVLIFEKTDRFDRDLVATRLATQLTSDIANVKSADAGYNMLMLTDAERQAQQSGGTWSRLFDRESLANRYPVATWYLGLQLMALAAFPLCWRVLRRLPDGGYGVSKTIGLLGAAYIAWLLASLRVMEFGRSAVLIGIIGMAMASVLAIGGNWGRFASDVRSRWRAILVAEAVFLAAFLFFVWLRSINPDLWHPARGGEKPMEFAYFNAVIRSTHFPAYDPWFAGGYINYYYFGFVLMAAITLLTGVVPEVAFNLAIATCFALAVVNAWSFVASAVDLLGRTIRIRSRWAPLTLGLVGPLLVMLIGNLDMARRIGAGEWGYTPVSATGLWSLGSVGDIVRGVWRAISDPRSLPPDAFWTPSRIIDGTINEFPYFSFLFADLHPHLMSIPFTICALVVALGVIAARDWPKEGDSAPTEPDQPFFGIAQGWRTWWREIPKWRTVERLLLVTLVGLVTGVLFPLNTWDYPTAILVVAGAFVILELLGSAIAMRRGRRLNWHLTFSSLRRAALWTVLALVVGRLLFWPYFANYQVQNSGFDPWEVQSRPDQYLLIHGTLLFFVVSFLLAELASSMPARRILNLLYPSSARIVTDDAFSTRDERQISASFTIRSRGISASPFLLVAFFSGLLILISLLSDQIMILFLGLFVLVGAAAWKRQDDPVRLFLIGMVALALAISAAVENFALRGDIGRMNTVFKFYLQVWILLGLAAAVGLVVLVFSHGRFLSWSARAPWLLIAALLVMASLVYPAYATPARLDDRFAELPRTLDGMAYMDQAVYFDAAEGRELVELDLGSDKEAIRWLQDNVQGSPVILEAVTPLYRWGSRISVYTGMPTVIGWDWHQTQQRPGYQSLIDQRKLDVQRIYGEIGRFENIRPLLDRYHVQYIYVGDLERAYYDAAALQKFEDAAAAGRLEVVYDQDGVTIYRYPLPD